MIIISGVLILIGGLAMVGTPAPEGVERNPDNVIRSRYFPNCIRCNKDKEVIKLEFHMQKCEKCGENTSKGYDCEHTEFEEYCKECYTELHYYITEKKDNE